MVDDLRAGRTQARKKASAAMSARTAQTDAEEMTLMHGWMGPIEQDQCQGKSLPKTDRPANAAQAASAVKSIRHAFRFDG